MYEDVKDAPQCHVTPRMKGNNELHFCGAEMHAIVQEYINARFGSYAPFVKYVKYDNVDNCFIVQVTDEAPSV